MPVRPCPVLLKTLRMLQVKNPSSGLRFKHEIIAFTNIAFTTHFNQIVTCTYAMAASWKSCLHTVMRDKSLSGLPVYWFTAWSINFKFWNFTMKLKPSWFH